MKNIRVIFCLLSSVLCLLSSVFCPLSAQYWEFGQNKVQYKGFEWKVIDADKFSVIYHTGGEELAKFAKSVLTDAYNSHSFALSYTLSNPAPIIIYNSHNEFEQTNVTLSLIDEGTGGFTEIFKNRVVVPFNGSYAHFRHVIAHELMHVFQFAMSRGSGVQSIFSMGLQEVPLWVIEGMAEYFSLNWDSESDMMIRDALYWNRLKWIQDLYMIEGSYLMYKEGQSIIKFIADRYGEKKVTEVFNKARSLGGIDGAFKSALGVDTDELNRLWLRELKKEYWAQCVGKDEAPENARRLTQHKDYAFNTAPCISPDGNEIVFISDRNGYEDLYLMSTIDGRIKAKLISGGRTKGFETLHIMYGGITWHPNSCLIAFVAKSEGKDLIYVMDVRNKKIVKKFTPSLDQIFSPSFSPNGEFIALRGVKDGAADIYVLNYSTGELNPVTQDIYDDLTPSWSPDGKNIVFSSDRPAQGEKWKYGSYCICKIDAANYSQETIILKDRATYVASPLWVQIQDSAGIGDKIIFVSNSSGINNIYAMDLQDTTRGSRVFKGEGVSPLPLITQLTNVIGGIFIPSISNNGELLVFSNYINSGWDVYVLKYPLKNGIPATEAKTYPTRYTEIETDTTHIGVKNLSLRFSPDWGGGAVSYSPGTGPSGYLRFAISDLLGNHQIYVATSSPENLLTNYYISYFYLPRRVDFGVATFKEEQYFWDGGDILYGKQNLGAGVMAEYPLDRFQRIELQTIAYIAKEERRYIPDNYRLLSEEKFYQVEPYIAWIYDNSLWGATGPVNGERCKVSFKSALPVMDTSLIYNLYKLDLRKYIRITSNYQFATRLINMGIWGRDVNYLVDESGWPWLGGPDDLRGYKTGELAGRNAGVFNMELRYPFIDYLKIAFPIPITIRGIRGVMFCDFGYTTDDIPAFQFFENGGLKDLKLGFGTGIRLGFQYFVLKLDVAWNTDLITLSEKPYWYLSLSPEF
ncbi:MAG: PD40 domain-containing protein [Candidatus Stahlbacteria bacterium]|nr:PD40 domain-containing protein [Candidatus Stahlbacteria bacterium]